jgi:hypothetical protein
MSKVGSIPVARSFHRKSPAEKFRKTEYCSEILIEKPQDSSNPAAFYR